MVHCDEPLVLSLTVDEYDTAIKENSDIIIKHYTNVSTIQTIRFFKIQFCSFCGQLKPIFIEVASEMKAKYPQLLFAEIDLQDNPKIGRQLKVTRLPYVTYYKNGKKIEYLKGNSKA